MPEPAAPAADQIRACLLAVLHGDSAAAEDVLLTADCVAESRGLDADALRDAGLASAPAIGPAGVVLRALPCALLHHNDRPAARRSAHLAAAIAGVDEANAVVAVAVAVLASDLMRGFDIDTARVRCHQTLLEEAPTGVLNALRPFDAEQPLEGGTDAVATLQLAVTALHRADGVDAVTALFGDRSPSVAVALAAGLAAVHAGFTGFDAGRLATNPLRDRAESSAAALIGELAPSGA